MEYKVNINFVDGSETNGLCNVNHLFKDCVQAGSMMVEKQWIENSNASQMVRNIDEDEKIKEVTPIYNVYNGQYENQECLFLTEDGLYEVLMQVKTIRYSTVTTYIK
ncbi:hypothetical protein VN21_17280 [Paraclostridium benzoelyticum]|uniref:Uncharacterized protein n=1 Tax=Paraclostridium benzoelyticum TaxID=1629550 RepID=A0A0M3DC28_9FIRM|nr:hypothetical protein [Paraclostridium benzoelyticum]KKX99827.1 hypothetical protein VN21_17280 [Paraclostridium benzoelyticum]